MPTAKSTPDARTLAELTRTVFGEAMTMDQVFTAVLDEPPLEPRPIAPPAVKMWVGSIGYERYKTTDEFVARLQSAHVERLVDVRELPMSRRRGYGKTALGLALAEGGIEYVHMRGLGNPKKFRDLYKSGRVAEGRRGYQHHLLGERRDALDDLALSVAEKRTALMCVEHDVHVCHRKVIFDALEQELGIAIQRLEIG